MRSRPRAPDPHAYQLPENVYGSKKRLEWLARNLGRADRVLDFGCGTGALVTIPLMLRGFDIVGVDSDARSIAKAREIAAELGADPERFDVSTLEEISFRPRAIIAAEVLEHLPSPVLGATLDQFRAMLRPNGTLLVTVPNGYGWFEIETYLWSRLRLGSFFDALHVTAVMDKVRRAVLGHAADDPYPNTAADDGSPHVQRFTLDRVRRLLAQHGFDVIESTGSVLLAGPATNLFLRGFDPFLRLNAAIGGLIPPLASGFFLRCQVAR